MYLLAIFLPPLAIFLCGKPFQALLSIFATLLFWIPGMLWAILVVADHKATKRNKALIAATNKQTKAFKKASRS